MPVSDNWRLFSRIAYGHDPCSLLVNVGKDAKHDAPCLRLVDRLCCMVIPWYWPAQTPATEAVKTGLQRTGAAYLARFFLRHH